MFLVRSLFVGEKVFQIQQPGPQASAAEVVGAEGASAARPDESADSAIVASGYKPEGVYVYNQKAHSHGNRKCFNQIVIYRSVFVIY